MSGALLKAIEIIGSRKKLAKAIGTTTDAINAWLNRGVHVPLEYAFEIERVTGKRIKWVKIAPHLEHFSKRWSSFPAAYPYFYIQSVHVSLSRIIHAPYIQKSSDKIKTLIENIQYHGLQNPICIDTENHLIFGKKRVQAYKILGKKTILSWRLSLSDLLAHQYSAIQLHQIFKLSERIAIGLAIEKHLCKRQRQKNSYIDQKIFFKTPGRTDELIARLLSFGNRQSYLQAKKVYLQGIPALIKVVDARHISVSTAAALACLPEKQQKKIIALSKKDIIRFVKKINNNFNGSA